MYKAIVFAAAALVLCCVLGGCSETSGQNPDNTANPSDVLTDAPDNGTQTEEPTVTDKPVVTEKEKDDVPAVETDTVNLSLPQSNTEMSKQLSVDLLNVCSSGSETAIKNAMNSAGFETLFTGHFDKKTSDPSHTSAYAVGKGRLNGKNAYIVVIRGTNGGEWYSNFDFAPSHTGDSPYAENFMAAAQDIYASVKDIFEADRDAYIFVCGHSRGAAAANLLGVLLDGDGFDNGGLYVYTYATPNTVKSGSEQEYNNIFNFINRKDIVTYLPPEHFGFERAGTDIILNGDAEPDTLFLSPDVLYAIAPDIESYYNDKHSFTEAGLSEDGITVFEIMTKLGGLLGGVDVSFLLMPEIGEESDLYPLVDSLSDFTDLNALAAVFAEHLPDSYLQLIKKI